MKTEFIIKSSAACMPSSCWGTYRRIAVMEVERGTFPKFIGERARGVVRVVETWERLNVGKTDRDAFSRAWREAERLVESLNAERAEAREAAREKRRRAKFSASLDLGELRRMRDGVEA